MPPAELDGRARVVIEGVWPEIDGGQFPIKRIAGAAVTVEADVFADGHGHVAARVLYRREGDEEWRAEPMQALGNDRWRGRFQVGNPGRYAYVLEGWIDRFGTWRGDLVRRIAAGQDVDLELAAGAALVADAAGRIAGDGQAALHEWATALRQPGPVEPRVALALSPRLAAVMARHDDRRFATRYRPLFITVDPVRAQFSSWYELFPRSWASGPGRHATLRDSARWLDYVASMGFDVIYLPPVHPIGRQFRKGRNNSLVAEPGDVGSPWAIGGPEGGHTAIHPDLGTLEDFRQLVDAARARGIELALDIAFQCSADHPWLSEHPEWFKRRPDGSIACAENPPKLYQDVYPLDFECEDWRGLWQALHDVILFWVQQGVTIFRVDNPHTKALPFWSWAIDAIKRTCPEVLFLSEAFTRPKVMHRLAKLGFSQSYTYFIWRNSRQELTDYFRELTSAPVREYMRPNLWPNTPDILPRYLQEGGRPAFVIRLVLAATLGASYGIYGPAYELCENVPREPGTEEYLDSEKYELRTHDVDAADSLRELIGRVNRVRRENPALHSDWHLRFHDTDNEMLICYSKTTEDRSNVLIVVVNLDDRYTQCGWVTLDLAALGLTPDLAYHLHDLLDGGCFQWTGPRNYVELNPRHMGAHVLLVRQQQADRP